MPTFGHGTTLSWGGTVIGTQIKIGGIKITSDEQEITTHQSTGYFKEFMQTLMEAGAVPISGLYKYDDVGQLAMLTDMKARTQREVIMTLPGGAGVFTCTGFIKEWGLGEAASNGAIEFAALVRFTGVPTFVTTPSTGLTTPFFSISENAVIGPAPAGDAYDYVANVVTAKTSVTITPTAAAGVITVNGNIVASGVASSAIALGAAGSLTTITVVVTETGKTPKTYVIKVFRAAS